MATEFLNASMLYSLTFLPPTNTSPLVASYNLGISCTKLVLPEPVLPIIPTVSPALIFMLIFSRLFSSLSSSYLKLTFLNSISPSLTSITALAGSTISGSSSNTSKIREADATDLDIIIRTIEIIIRDIRIWNEYVMKLVNLPTVNVPA